MTGGQSGRRRTSRCVIAALAAITCAATAFAADPPTPQAIRAARDEVFKRPEFQYQQTEPGGSSLLERLLGGWRDFILGLKESYPILFTLLMVALALVAAVLIAHLLWTWRVARQARYAPEVDPRDLEAALRRLDAAPFRALALSHAAAGRWEEAVRDLYTALLLTLDRRGALRYAGHKALLDYRIECAQDAEARAVLDRFADAYPAGSFGRRPPDAARFRDLVAALDAVSWPAEKRG